METHEMATRFTVSALPLDDPDAELFAVTVEYRGAGWWAVCRAGMCLSRAGRWDREPLGSERTEPWLAEHRYTLEEARRRAHGAAAARRLNGMDADLYRERRGEMQRAAGMGVNCP